MNHRLLVLAIHAATFAAFLPAKAFASDETLETVSVIASQSRFGATKSDTPITESARSISVETAAMLADKGALNLSQATTYMAGVTGETYGFATRGDWVRSRGLDVPRYRDSIQELFGSYNSTRAEVFTMEQVEVLKGPASVLYGQGSPGGIVNYVSKTPKAQSAGELSVSFGNHDRKQLQADFTGALSESGQWLYRVVALARESDSQVDYVDDNTRVLMPSVTYAPTDDSSYTLIGMMQDTDSDTASQFIPIQGTLEPLADGSYLDQDVYVGEPGFNRYNTRANQLTFLMNQTLTDALSLEGTLLWREGEADYHQAWAVFTGAGNSRYLNDLVGVPVATSTTVARSFYQADNTFNQAAADVRLRGDFSTGELSHELMLGVQYQAVTTDANRAYYYGGGALQGDFSLALDLANPVYGNVPDQATMDALYVDQPEQQVKDAGIYLNDYISWHNWRITLGVRQDEVKNDVANSTQTDRATSFGTGLLYAFDNGLSPYVSYAESFNPVIGVDANGDQLNPEESRQYEAGVKYEPEGLPALITLAYFDIEISNLPNPNSLPATAGQQQGISTLKGLELEARARLGEFYVQAALSSLDAKDPNGFALAATPESQAALWVDYQPERIAGLKVGAGVRHVGASISENDSLRYKTPAYTLFDAMLGFQVNHWAFSLNARNLSDEQYLTSCLTRGDCFPGLRRSVVAKASYNF
ncbi:TonB-dependent siderophore receptor [Simiduia sp. 21SJ11W-1]|uniref:TonB-dependent siderophore receptor n=1 Tax=Simiduia sp. 21SJ11W-1 TaxID=2909669 RepID=UPI0020A181FA|nr:TonB-dependent siderophore receptor [Simiduia sp. 21SJ11W-1]UTA48965.1 TonB-dependent siderophore receptor [Simiduia sp. 21SJ11W-1]